MILRWMSKDQLFPLEAIPSHILKGYVLQAHRRPCDRQRWNMMVRSKSHRAPIN